MTIGWAGLTAKYHEGHTDWLLRLAPTAEVIRAVFIADIGAVLTVEACSVAFLSCLALIVSVAVVNEVLGTAWELDHRT